MARRRNKLDYFAFFPKDCEADESIRMMDDAQFGFWMRCLCYQWPNGSIPADVGMLALAMSGRAPGGVVRTPEYITEMLAGPVGKRMQPHPTKEDRLADKRLLEEREIAEEESTRNKTNRATKTDESVEGKTDDSCDNSLFCSVLNTEQPNEVEDWFETEIWKPYPKKVSKPQALKAARAHGKTVADRKAITDGLKRALPELIKQHREGYCPNPATWLNGERWNDETPAASAAPTQQSTMSAETRRRIAEAGL